MGCMESKTMDIMDSSEISVYIHDDMPISQEELQEIREARSRAMSIPKLQDIEEGSLVGALELDHRISMTGKEYFKLRQSWKAIHRAAAETGVEMFVRFFKSMPELQQMFTNFRHLKTDDEMRSNEHLEHHATNVMSTIDEAITHIDNYDYVTDVVRKIGASHLRFAGFTSAYFWTIKGPFLEAVKITLGDRYTENMAKIYEVATNFILTTIADGLDEAVEASERCSSNPGSHPPDTAWTQPSGTDSAPAATTTSVLGGETDDQLACNAQTDATATTTETGAANADATTMGEEKKKPAKS